MLVATTSLVAASCQVSSTAPVIHSAEGDGEIISSEAPVPPPAGGAAVNPLSERAQRIKSGRETPAAPGAEPVQIAPPPSPASSPAPPGSGRWDSSERFSESRRARGSLPPRTHYSEYVSSSLGQDGKWQSPLTSTGRLATAIPANKELRASGREYARIKESASEVAGEPLREERDLRTSFDAIAIEIAWNSLADESDPPGDAPASAGRPQRGRKRRR